MLEKWEENGIPRHPVPGRSQEKGEGRGPASKKKGPYPREQPLPRSLPSGSNSVPRRCPPQNEETEAFPFYRG